MFDRKILEAYKKLFNQVSIITSRNNALAGDFIYINVLGNKVKAKCLSNIKINQECAALKDENNNYFIICNKSENRLNEQRNITYRKISKKKRKQKLKLAILYCIKEPSTIYQLPATVKQVESIGGGSLSCSTNNFNFLYEVPAGISSISTYKESPETVVSTENDKFISQQFGTKFEVPESLDLGYALVNGNVEYLPNSQPFRTVTYGYILGVEDASGSYSAGSGWDDTGGVPVCNAEINFLASPFIQEGNNGVPTTSTYYLLVDGQSIFIDSIYNSRDSTTDVWLSSFKDKIYIHIKTYINENSFTNAGEFDLYFRNRLYAVSSGDVSQELRDRVVKISESPYRLGDALFPEPYIARFEERSPFLFSETEDWRNIENDYQRQNHQPEEGILSPLDNNINKIKNKVYKTPTINFRESNVIEVMEGNLFPNNQYQLNKTIKIKAKYPDYLPENAFVVESCVF